MAKWDLTTRIGAYLDRHLVFPLMEFLSGKGIFNEKELLKGKFELLKNTKMIDFAADIYKQIHEVDHAPEEMSQRRNEIVEKLKEYKEKLKPVIKVFSEDEVISQTQSLRDGKQFLDYLVKNWEFKESYIEMFYSYAKFQYECGNYSVTAEYLFFFRILVQPSDRNYLNCLWGKFASEILMQNWDVALDDLNRLKEYIESNTMYTSALHSLQQRAWLIHWSLFVFFNHNQGKDLIIEMCLLQPQYLNVIQTTCPHILRYLTAAVIINKQRRSVMKDLIKVIQQESYTYRDPITEFVECLYVNFDFDGAQQKLRECETVLGNDFFLVSCLDDFMENARLVIFETFCRIHECISISMLAEKLNMKPDAAERWIVNLIRNARLDAKIDSKLGHVVMGTQAVSPYQQLIEKTKALAFRTQLLTANVEKKINSSHPDRAFSHWGNQDF